MMKSNFLIFCIFCISTDINGINLNYTPFNPNKEIIPEEFNSIYGTGNKLKDAIFESACLYICNLTKFNNNESTLIKKQDENTMCCTAKSLTTIKCMDTNYCIKLRNNLTQYLIEIIFISYFSLMIVTTIVMFIIFYCISLSNISKRTSTDKKDNNADNVQYSLTHKQAFINGLVAALLVVFTGLVLPIIILKIISIFKNISLTRILGGNFKAISADKLIFSTEIKNLERKRKYIVLEENHDDEMNSKNDLKSHLNNHVKNSTDNQMEQTIDPKKKLNMIDDPEARL